MKLWVLLDENVKTEQIQSGDVILATPTSAELLANKNCTLVITNLCICDEKTYASDAVKEIFDYFPKNLHVYENKFYMSVARPLCAVIYQVHTILESNDVEEVILLGGSQYSFMSCYRTNGEGMQAWFKTSWLMNPIIARYVLGNYQKVKLTWKKKGMGCFQHVINIFRENVFLIKIAILELHRRVIFQDDSTLNENDYKEIKSVGIAQMNLQLNHLKMVLSKMEDSNAMVVTNNVDIKSYSDQKIIRICPNQINDILRFFVQAKRKPKAKRISISMGNGSIMISNRDVYRALYTEILFHKLTENSFVTTINKLSNVEKIYTDGTFGTDMVLCHRYAQSKGIKHINYQYVSMDKMLFPIVELADEFYLFARKTYELYRTLSNSYKFYLPIYGEPRKGNKENLIISIFLQPDEYTIRYIKLLKNLIPVFDEIVNIKEVIVKPHYRQLEIQEINNLIEKTKKFKMCSKDESATEIIKNSDIMMSISSSVLFEAVSHGTPGIIIDLDKLEKDIIFSNDSYGKEINFYIDNIDDIVSFVCDYDSMIEKYISRRNAYLSQIHKELC